MNSTSSANGSLDSGITVGMWMTFIWWIIRGSSLKGAVPLIEDFLRTHLHLSLNARKTRIISCSCGVPFLGAVVCPNGRFLRSRTRRHLNRRWTETLRTESDPYVLLSVRNAREGFLKHFGG